MSYIYPVEELKQKIAELKQKGLQPPPELEEAIAAHEAHEAEMVNEFNALLQLKRQQRSQA